MPGRAPGPDQLGSSHEESGARLQEEGKDHDLHNSDVERTSSSRVTFGVLHPTWGSPRELSVDTLCLYDK